MRKLLAWGVVLLLAGIGTAWASEDDEMRAAIEKGTAQIQELERQAAEAENPEAREKILRKAQALREKVERLEARLAALAAPQDLVARGHEMHEAARQHLRMLEGMLAQLRQKHTHLSAEGRREEAARVLEHFAKVERLLQANREALAQLEEGKARLEHGRYEAAREAFEQAEKRLREVHEAARRLTGTDRPPGDGRPPDDPQARIEHLRAAAHHLREAGAGAEADALERKATEMARALEAARRQGREGPSGPDAQGVVLEALRELHAEVRELRREVRELREALHR